MLPAKCILHCLERSILMRWKIALFSVAVLGIAWLGRAAEPVTGPVPTDQPVPRVENQNNQNNQGQVPIQEKVGTSRVTHVTVYPNSALVTREVEVPEGAGAFEVVVTPLPEQ